MIRLGDALILAGTKLRTHKIRTTITIGLSSILFAVLVAACILAQGTIQSLASFNDHALNGRYLVLATADSPLATLSGGSLSNPTTLALAKQFYPQIVNAKTKDAAKLGVSYDPKSEPQPVLIQENPGHPSTEHLNLAQSYAAQQALSQYLKDRPAPGIKELQQIASPYHPKAIYVGQAAGANGGSIEIMPNGQENFTATEDEKVNLDFYHNVMPEIVDQGIVTPFIAKGVIIHNDDVPIIAPYDTVEKLLGLSALPSKATAQQKYDRIQELYQKMIQQPLAITTCYRNSVSAAQMASALDYQQNSSSKDYQKPPIIYGLPIANSCGAAPVMSDSRTAAEKKQQAAEDQFKADFGGVVAPKQQKITFQIIGLTPTVNPSNKMTFGGLLGSITGSSLGEVYAIPRNMLDRMSNVTTLKNIFSGVDQASPIAQALSDPSASYGYTVEFSSANQARNFIENDGCTLAPAGGVCAKPGGFHLMATGNNSIALEDLQQKMTMIVLAAAAVVVALAVIIMTTMIGRTIGDSRRETAVFRALGAKRGDIGVIYTIYTLWLSAIVASIALVVGVVGTYIFNQYYEHMATLQARLLFNAVNTHLSFNFFSLNPLILGAIVGLALLTGLLSMIIPLLRNIPRSPIKDMREE